MVAFWLSLLEVVTSMCVVVDGWVGLGWVCVFHAMFRRAWYMEMDQSTYCSSHACGVHLSFEFGDTEPQRAFWHRVGRRVGLFYFNYYFFGLVSVLLSLGFGSEFVTHRAHVSRTTNASCSPWWGLTSLGSVRVTCSLRCSFFDELFFFSFSVLIGRNYPFDAFFLPKVNVYLLVVYQEYFYFFVK